MTQLRTVGRVTRVGHSLAVFIPAPEARRAGLKSGQSVDLTIETEVPEPFGLLRDIATGPFERWREETRRDRI